MDQESLMQQQAELERQLKADLEACRATRRKLDATNFLLGQMLGAADTTRSKPMANSVGVAFDSTLEAILGEDREEKSIMESVRQLLENARGVFSARTLVEAINKNRTRALSERDVRHPLWKLQKQGVVRVYKQGSGKRPSIYIKA